MEPQYQYIVDKLFRELSGRVENKPWQDGEGENHDFFMAEMKNITGVEIKPKNFGEPVFDAQMAIDNSTRKVMHLIVSKDSVTESGLGNGGSAIILKTDKGWGMSYNPNIKTGSEPGEYIDFGKYCLDHIVEGL